ncbi:hypothetical protein H9Y04_15965 [Streptomyces sp. TRM66268-LWL]|uniref:LigA protein n=1 Tax=Streptomyces polyasparticus TaxID=2767826 RepID=A0ABR7SEY2_9ACTN|nr:hypothetical protein [Streptomyces polyasparticus]MBC9714061.1 hypothetical protein [Streptomyces polyasparticus]
MTTTLATSPTAHRAAVDLAAVREQWGDLLAAIGRRPAAEWPPRDSRAYIDGHLAEQSDDVDDEQPVETVGRLPLLLREHPAPLNLGALDAAIEVERELFDLADQVAGAVQRPIRAAFPHRGQYRHDSADAADPARWHYQAPTSPGSRAFGLHWAAVWLEGRALEEMHGDLFRPMPVRLLDHIALTAHRARRTVERSLGRDGRTTTLDAPCPYCGGQLAGHTRSGGEPVVTCSTGSACGAPVLLDDRHRRAWRGAELVGLFVAMESRR